MNPVNDDFKPRLHTTNLHIPTDRPLFQITNIHIRNLRGIRALDLPEDGMGWKDGFPPVVMIGGANGSGKTTLLRCIARACRVLAKPESLPKEVSATECLIDFSLSDGRGKTSNIRFLCGEGQYLEANDTNQCYGYRTFKVNYKFFRQGLDEVHGVVSDPKRFAESNLPRLIFLPSENRDLIVPGEAHIVARQLEDKAGFVAWWEWSRDKQWKGSTLELLYWARWADLNAKEIGRQDQAIQFERYTRAFHDLTRGKKHLVWTINGDLVVELAEGGSHPINDLSSGERQALFLLAELRRLWRPGSLVLIDELELHLHDAWQGSIYESLISMQKELGGQVLITTQSHSLFEMAKLGTRVLLDRGGLQ